MKHIEKINLRHWLKYAEKFWKDNTGIQLDLADEIDTACCYQSQKEFLLSMMPCDPKQHLKDIKKDDLMFKLHWKIFEVKGALIKLEQVKNYYEKQLRLLKG
ncbi:MAG: hypothetical protein HQ541_10065 [Mariniphaga sp.]|nr:hypothetical protein [Mariniphaga sp.]